MSSQRDATLLRIIERMPLPAVIASPLTAKVLWVNSRLVKMAGAESASRVVGTSILDWVQPPQASVALRDLAKVALGQSPPPVTYDLMRLNGERAAGQVSSVPMMFEGKPAMLSFIADVTEHDELVRRVRESEERYRQLLESMPVGVVIIADERIEYANLAVARVVGYPTSEELLAMSPYDLVAEDARPSFRQSRREAMRTKSTQPTADVTLLRADGSTAKAALSTSYIRWNGTPATQTFIQAAEQDG